MKKNILVTGSSGLIGSEVVKFFSNEGWTVHGVDNNQREVFFGKSGSTRWNQQRLMRLFKNFNQTALTNWTIASIVATHCGIPLKNYGVFTFGEKKGKHLRTLFGMQKFLPKATCLGDLLKKKRF